MDTFQDQQVNRTRLSSQRKSGYDPRTGIYHSLIKLKGKHKIPTKVGLDTASFVLSQFSKLDLAESRVALIDSANNHRVTYGQLKRSIYSLAAGLYHGLGVRKGDLVFLLSPNSTLYPTICLAILLIGGVVTTANPVSTVSELTKQVLDSSAKLAIAAPEEMHKLLSTGVPTLVTTRKLSSGNELSVEELIDCCESMVLPENHVNQSDTAAVLYSSGTTGTSKGVILTHRSLISMITILKWAVDITSAKDDIFLCFIPMFHIYGLAFFGLGLLSAGTTTVLMRRFDFKGMLEAIQTYKVNSIPAVPPVILGLVKYNDGGYDLSSLRSVGSGAAPLSQHLAHRFRAKFPWVELKPGYGLTESCGAASFFVTAEEAKARSAASGALLPSFYAKVVDPVTRTAMGPYGEGELWLKGPAVMKGYLGNKVATSETIDADGWLRTGDLCYFDEDGYLFIVDRIKELIKYNGYQVAPYKKIKKVTFIDEIPKSVARKFLRKDLVAQSKQNIKSKL